MFTGLVLESGRLEARELTRGGVRLRVSAAHPDFAEVRLGDSIAVNGACLTVVEATAAAGRTHLDFEVSPETLAKTGLGELKLGERVHLELSLRLGDRLGGHLVSGHVDGRGQVCRLQPVASGEYWALEIEVKHEAWKQVAPYLVAKGSITVDGVSLTVNRVTDDGASTRFEAMLIPHTLEVTRFRDLSAGSLVNLEADVLAKYAARGRAVEGFAL